MGSYSLTAKATDAYGISNLSAVVSVKVNPGVAQVYYIHPDHLDTPRVITDTAGNVVWDWQNTDPFGNNMPNENPSGLGQFVFDLRFAGQTFDKETGLHQNHFRDYDPANGGRYIESDPIGLEGGINTYAYVGGDSISKADLTGLIEWRGTGTSAGLIANGEARYTLTSDCVDGYKMEVVVSVTYASAGSPLPYVSTSGASFTDNFEYINPYVFDGPAFNVSAGIAAKWGTGFDLTTLGGAQSPGGWSAQKGGGVWAGASFGSSKVIGQPKSIPCSCQTK